MPSLTGHSNSPFPSGRLSSVTARTGFELTESQSRARAMSSASSSSHLDVAKICVVNVVAQGSMSSGSNGGTQPKHLHLSKKEPLSSIVQELCQHWHVQEPQEDFALQFESTKKYVTEDTKADIVDGTILKFCQSPKRLVRELVGIFQEKDDPLMQVGAFKSLEVICLDVAVALEFVDSARGLELIIESAHGEPLNGNLLSHLIRTFHTIMSHPGLVSWEDERIPAEFVQLILTNIDTEKSMRALKQDESTQECSLSILNALANTPSRYHEIERDLSIRSLLNFLQADNPNVQRMALTLFNSLFRLGDRAKKMSMKQIMEEKNMRRVIVDNIIRREPETQMQHQLYILQSLLLNPLQERMITGVEAQDQKALEKIKELRRIAFEGHNETTHSGPRPRFSEDYRKLGFKNEIDPTQDFRVVPPGILGLDIMFSFAMKHKEEFIKLVLETSCRNDHHDCPFAQITIGIVKLICEISKIGQDIQEQGGRYYPMLFAEENPIEELSAIMIRHVARTWSEMSATIEDFNKVLEVAREQLMTALATSPLTLEDFRRGLKTFAEISDNRKEEAKNRGERDGKAIQLLQESLLPDMWELVSRQRVNFLMAGTRFSKIKKEGKEKHAHVFIRLSSNQKSILYGDWSDDKIVPSSEHLTKKLAVSEIKEFLTGSACIHIKDIARKNNRSNEPLVLTFLRENGDTLDVTAPDQKTFDMWSDGINFLLGRTLKSKKAEQDLHMLLSMEVKVRLLELEGIVIPEEAPPIPKLPTNFNNVSQEVQ